MSENTKKITRDEAQNLTLNSKESIDSAMDVGYDRIRESAAMGVSSCSVPYLSESLYMVFVSAYRDLGYNVTGEKANLDFVISW